MTNAPTPRETADHAELATKPIDVLAILRADRLPECSFDDGRTWVLDGVGVAETFSRSADTIDALLSEIEALRGQYELDNATIQTLADQVTQAERQRDELRKALGDVLFVRKDNPKASDRWMLEEVHRISRIALANQGSD